MDNQPIKVEINKKNDPNNLQENSKQNDNKETTAYSTIHIICKDSSYYFKATYNEDNLEGVISKLEFEKIINNFTMLMGKSLYEKRELDKIEMPKILKTMSIISIFLALLYIIMIVLTNPKENNSSSRATLIIGIICLSITIIILFLLSIYNYFRKEREFIPLKIIVYRKINEYIIKLNEMYKENLIFDYIQHPKHYMIEVKVKIVDVPKKKNDFDEENSEEEEDEDKLEINNIDKIADRSNIGINNAINKTNSNKAGDSKNISHGKSHRSSHAFLLKDS
jgi:hypothetical protein